MTKSSGGIIVGLLFIMVILGIVFLLVIIPWKSDRDFRRYVSQCLSRGGRLSLEGSVFIGQEIICNEEE